MRTVLCNVIMMEYGTSNDFFIYLLINTCSIYLLISREMEKKSESLTLMSYENEDGILHAYPIKDLHTNHRINDGECLVLNAQI